ncbi:MAG: RNA methyltransferase [Chitinophagaceae bacterium]|nr:RNA methyltransferase [Chitinophagaceae bacterium]
MLSRNTVKYIQSLSHKKFRNSSGSFIAETPKVVEEFLRSSLKVEHVYTTEQWTGLHNTNKELSHFPITVIPQSDLEKISQLKTPHDILAVMKIPEPPLPKTVKGRFSLALDGVQDPGNLGTIIRIADWFGIENIFCGRDTADAYNPKVVQATMGSLAHVNVHYVDLETFLPGTGIEVIATVLDGESLYETTKSKEGIVVIGNESAGIREPVLKLAKKRLTIPRIGKAESLNAGVAAAIVLSHLVR